MSTLTWLQGSDWDALYIDENHVADAYHGELWGRGYLLDVVDEYDIDNVERIFCPDVRDHGSVPDSLNELEESDQWTTIDYDVEITKRDSVKLN